MQKPSTPPACWFVYVLLICLVSVIDSDADSESPTRSALPLNPASSEISDPEITFNNPFSGGSQKSVKAEQHETVVAGFHLEGSKHWERVNIQDMSVIVTASGQRYMALYRLLKALRLEKTDFVERVEFQPDGLPLAVINRNSRELILNGHARKIDFIEEVSEITGEPELYLTPEAVSEILGFDVRWDELAYTFSARTSRRLSVWKIASGPSLLAVNATEASTTLPELFPTAYPANFSLDFMELRTRASLGLYLKEKQAIVDSLQQTFWGSLSGGTYKFQFSQPPINLYNKRRSAGESSPVMLNRGEWKYRTDTTELSIGDSTFGLNDLTFPAVRMTGVRFNGFSGGAAGGKFQDRSSLGLRNSFMQRRLFQGVAPLGSQVELIVNDRVMDTQEALTDGLVPAGVGVYRFEEVYLPPGNLNEVRIVITEPDGRKSYLQWNLLGNSSLVPAKKIAYLGGAGTSRDAKDWSSRGLFAGARAMYGASDRLTVGGTVAYQQDFYKPLRSVEVDFNNRQIPESSMHAGAQLLWNPFSYLMMVGDVSLSQSREKAGADSLLDTAVKISADLYPSRLITFHSQLFRYGPDFFDGQNTKLHDRMGYAVHGLWRISPSWELDASFGSVQNNLNGEQDETLIVDFQSLQIVSRVLPNSTLTLGADRLSENIGNQQKMLYTVKLVSHPFKDLTFEGSMSTGNSMAVSQDQDFASGLRLPGLSSFKFPSGYAVLRKPLSDRQELGASYWRSGNRERATLLHSARIGEKLPVYFRTELGYDTFSKNLYFDNRTQYYFDQRKTRNIEFQSRLEENNWTISVYLNILELLSFSGARPRWITEGHIQADAGGVQGKVFLDYNANGLMEADEPGVENVKVLLDGAGGTVTDDGGYYILPGAGQPKKARVFFDQKTIPAIYSASHGIQSAQLVPGTLTEINLGMTPVIAVTGFVYLGKNGKSEKPLPGIRIMLKNGSNRKLEGDSITAADGSFYIGDVKPGKYVVEIDHKNLPQDYSVVERERHVEILPSKETVDFKLDTFIVNRLASGRS